jgi:secondary thiamine-phosphate synthase enzyme
VTEWLQKEIRLAPKARGFHLVTREITAQLPELQNYKTGLAHIFIKHTSASLALNENADPDVRADLESHFNQLAPENAPYYRHTMEGPDDMPAHIKAVLLGSSVTVPVSNGRFNLGTWQGIYLCEHRNQGGARMVVVTVVGGTVSG